jgi:hypothetical protein
MEPPAPRAAAGPPVDLAAARIAACCSHVRVPAAPAAAGYRYLDLGGDVPPFYLRRFERDGLTAAITLRAPLELSTGDAAERGAPGIARALVSVGASVLPWASVASFDLPPALRDEVLAELARLELMRADHCPVCRPQRLVLAS